ncbi:YciI family protein [Planomicrobium sp. CPCC 101110]|uniref:YciI family protein n=1 Tax=Planomicrobium sp. CPCC 101110 TaxID=2599619 RepID=UPI0011B3F7CC|nr:YciI family protein [Planomicrobium sp. CPCC 101110]TWT27862.1 hypothetical protein FQV30_04980 [Planomicrobium sp. CPCC 101110]
MPLQEGKKFFAVLLPMLDREKSQHFRADHLSFLEMMRNDGHVCGNGRFVDGSGGLVIYQAVSFSECEAYVNQDPYVKNGARSYEIHEWEAVWA